MKIGFFLVHSAIISGDSNGVKGQARAWKEGLEARGHKVEELNVWGNYSWQSYDVLHIFGTGLWLYSFVKQLSKKNANIVVSPIIDSIQSPFKYKLSTFLGFEKLRLFSPTFSLKKALPYVKGVYVRSDYESLFFSKSMNLNQDKIFKIMLPYDSNIEHSTSKVTKEKFCLHISSIYQERKNVIRLIKAAKKYNFNLILAGFKGADHEFEPLKREIGNSDNIKVLGFISKEEMIDLYERAKVFALPSISEGVGMVAIDAAAYGCDIVITNIGGPKEYYNNMAEIVNPFDIDEIGKSIKKLLTDNTYQPNLQKYIHTKFNKSLIAESLEATYLKVVAV